MSWVQHVIERRSASMLVLLLIVAMGFIGWMQPQAFPNEFVVWIIFAAVAYEFQKRLDQGVPLIQLTALIAVAQWLVGPVLTYNYGAVYEYDFQRYAMAVPPERYFGFAMPATCFYVAIMLATGASVRQQNLLSVVSPKQFVLVGIVLNIIGNAGTFLAPPGGGSLAFLFHLVGQLKYIGALYFLMSKHPLKLVFAAACLVRLFGDSFGTGMFHELVIWLMVLFCYWFAQRNWSVASKAVFLTLAFCSLFAIQVVKLDYRERLQNNEEVDFLEMATDYLRSDGKAWEEDSLAGVITRINQGWIISNVLSHVPNDEPFAEGETIKDALIGAAVPRMFYKDKKKAGGRENFIRFTGLELNRQTSMAISPLGEAYANFGELGGILFMVVYGALFAIMFYGVLKYSTRNPTFLLWIPLIFYQAIKAETEVVVVINQLTKGAVVAFAAHYLIRQTFYPNATRRPAPQRQQPSPPQRNELSPSA